MGKGTPGSLTVTLQATASTLAWDGMASADSMVMAPRAQALQLEWNTGCPSLEL